MMEAEAAEQIGLSADSKAFGARPQRTRSIKRLGTSGNHSGLDKRSRSLVTIAIAQRQPYKFSIQMAAGISNGPSLKEIDEVVVQALPYVGYPAVSTALRAA